MLTPLMKLAERTDACILGVAHVTKPNGTSRTAAQHVMGSSEIVNMARVVMMTVENDEGERVLGVVKNNLSMFPPALIWDREEEGPIRWLGKSDQSVDQILGASGGTARVAKVDGAEEWLREFLAGGAKLALDAQDAGKLQLYTDSTLDRASQRLGVVKWKEEKLHGKWWWMLPPGEPNYPDTPAPDPQDDGDDDQPNVKVLDPMPVSWTITDADIERAVANLSTFTPEALAEYRIEVAATESVGKGSPLARAALAHLDAKGEAVG
jgi:hypothetical protein